jgi:ADP-ribose pyrophosphatase YjhB (NUDIX family)
LSVKVGVAAVVWREGRFLLIRRGKAPSRGLWAFPGGSIDLGEPLLTAAHRELAEETGVAAETLATLAAVDVIAPPGADTSYHFVLVPVLMRWLSGEGIAADDAEAAGWFTPDEIASLAAVPTLPSVLADACRVLEL